MADERVQLKREEVVGSEIVLKDINPKSSTNSIDDSKTGARLDQTIDRLWNSINNKLSRIVNSVNGRTGVVVLNANDVGLGNVDNVSFADIKKWVINKLAEEFGNKRIKLFETLHEADTLAATNDEIYRDSPYFSMHGYNADKKSYIGYIYLDTETNTLQHTCLPINTVGYTDNSIIYDEKLSDDKDFTGGGIGVNIYQYEDALELYNGLSKSDSGLRINKDKLVSSFYYFDGVYGNGSVTDTEALLYHNTDSIPENAPSVKIFIDDREVAFGFKLRREGLKIGDLLYCTFRDYRFGEVIGTGMSTDVMCRNPGIGRVEAVPSTVDGSGEYVINFYTISPNLGWGLKYANNHKNGITDKEITIKLAKGYAPQFTSFGSNISGLQVYRGNENPNQIDGKTFIKLTENMRWSVLPEGATRLFVEENSDGGLFITPDMSLCVMPYDAFGPKGETGSQRVDNWAITPPSDLSDLSIENGALEPSCLFGINILKAREYLEDSEDLRLKFSNVSGLRISGVNHKLDVGFLGMSGEIDESDNTITSTGDTTGGISFDSATTGGISVNVGKFLEIKPGDFQPTKDTFYDGGKVNVRVGNGLGDDGNNRISINIGTENKHGLCFTGEDNHLGIKTDLSLKFDETGSLGVRRPTESGLSVVGDENDGGLSVNDRPLLIQDSYNNIIYYNPLEDHKTYQGDESKSYVGTITLGPGLKIEM